MTTPQKRRLRLLGWTLTYLCLGIVIMMLGYNMIRTDYLVSQTHEVTLRIHEDQGSNARVLNLVKDCTDPAGKCYRDGQHRTATAVRDISAATTQASIYAAYCAKQPGNTTVAQIERCVTRQFELARGNN